jgi:hypothetical protein
MSHSNVKKKTTMKAFHDDSEIKAKYLARVRSHRAADELIRGKGWDGHRGCAIGCTLEAYDHSRYPIELGIPEQLAHLEDWLFERLPVADAMAWPERVLSSIHVGADLSRVWPELAIWMLVDPAHGVLQDAVDISTRAAIVDVADLYRRTDEVSPDEWEAAHLAAAREAAAETAAVRASAAAAATAAAAVRASTARATAREAAWAAAAAATAARAAAAWAATAAAAAAARAATYAERAAPETWINVAADKLIALLESA